MDFKKKYLKYKSKYLSNITINYIKEKSSIIDSFYNQDRFFNMHNLNKLTINNDLNNIQNVFDKYKYIELRPYNNEKTLLIGCGNTRLDCGNLEPCESIERKNWYDNYHEHKNTYTIDPTIVSNPSIISYFKENITFPTIPDHSFDLIVFEGGGEPTSNPREIQRLLKNTTNTFCINMIEGKYVIYSYYLEGNYFIN